ncbi:MAG: hypothetical protein KKD86_11735, partial [Bacteroidetes bacterium]|nr:hypothetical protein [Bacteroidota bacterium]
MKLKFDSQKSLPALLCLILFCSMIIINGHSEMLLKRDVQYRESSRQDLRQLVKNDKSLISSIISSFENWNVGYGDQPDIAVDSHGNVHIVSTRYNYFTCRFRTSGVSPHQYTVIEWDTYHKTDHDSARFQVILFESGNIQVNIDNGSASINEFPITGVNQDSTHGIDVGSYPPRNKISIRFTWDGVSDYTWKEITYYWLDVTVGQPVWVETDDRSTPIPIGFDFTFYGAVYDWVFVSSNGYLKFTDIHSDEDTNPKIFPSGDEKASEVIAPLWDDWDPTDAPNRAKEIFYSMIDGNTGEVLIYNTMVSDWDGINSTRPSIVIDSDDKVHIAWQDKRWHGGVSAEITYTKLDPSLDDQDGDAAFEPSITVIDDKRLTNLDGWATSPRMAIDTDDNIHIVWENVYKGVYYMQIDNISSTEITEPTLLKDIPDALDCSINIAVDSKNNPHITWNDQRHTMIYETFYMMLNGIDNSIKKLPLIDATLITYDNNKASTGQSITVDDEDNVHIIWMEQIEDDVREIWYTKLNPALDSQDGNAADAAAITAISAKAIGANGGWVMRSASAYNSGKNISVSWWTREDNDIHYLQLDSDGNQVIADTKLTDAGRVGTDSDWMAPHCYVDAGGNAFVTWFDWRVGGIQCAKFQALGGRARRIIENS